MGHGITNLYINQLMKKISTSYRRTFSCNKIPYFSDQNFSIIINLSKDNEQGTHLISLFFLKANFFYFDSYGLKYNNIYISKYLAKYSKRIVYWKKPLQHILSDHCGFYCILFILFIENNNSLEGFLSLFKRKNIFK